MRTIRVLLSVLVGASALVWFFTNSSLTGLVFGTLLGLVSLILIAAPQLIDPGLSIPGKPADQPAMSIYEARTYTQLLPGGKAYLFHFLQEVKSFITRPSPGVGLSEPGFYEISGIAYSATGRISKVMVSADGGQSWAQAALQEPVQPKAFTRFRAPWHWDGGPAVLQSRAWDEAGNFQPNREEIIAHRGVATRVPSVNAFPNQHYNGPTSWGIDASGEVKHVYA